MHGYRLEVEAHVITAASATVENIRQAVAAAGVQVVQFVLNPLASAEVVLTESERSMGAVVCDIGGGTTDMAIYVTAMCGTRWCWRWAATTSPRTSRTACACPCRKPKK
jgi:cell division protein FtsA